MQKFRIKKIEILSILICLMCMIIPLISFIRRQFINFDIDFSLIPIAYIFTILSIIFGIINAFFIVKQENVNWKRKMLWSVISLSPIIYIITIMIIIKLN
jgi:hypothetical protein